MTNYYNEFQIRVTIIALVSEAVINGTKGPYRVRKFTVQQFGQYGHLMDVEASADIVNGVVQDDAFKGYRPGDDVVMTFSLAGRQAGVAGKANVVNLRVRELRHATAADTVVFRPKAAEPAKPAIDTSVVF